MVILRHFLKWVVGAAAITAAALLGANKLEASLERALVCGREFTPITGRSAVDIESYEIDNMTMARSVPLLAQVELDDVAHDPYHRCENGRIISDIVGVRSSFAVVLATGSDSCSVMTALERDLEASGWSVYTWDAPDDDGNDYVRAMNAARQHEQLELRIDGRASRVAVVADHDVPAEFMALTAGAPTTCA